MLRSVTLARLFLQTLRLVTNIPNCGPVVTIRNIRGTNSSSVTLRNVGGSNIRKISFHFLN